MLFKDPRVLQLLFLVLSLCIALILMKGDLPRLGIFKAPTSYQQPTTRVAHPPKDSGETSYKFVDDSFAAKESKVKPPWKPTKPVSINAKNFGDGSLTGETIKAAIEAR
jgi:hypothetical protein